MNRFRQFFKLLNSAFFVLRKNSVILWFSILLMINEVVVFGVFVLIALFFLRHYRIVLKLHDYAFALQHWYNWVYIAFYCVCLTYSMMILHAACVLYLWDRLKAGRQHASFFRSIGHACAKIKLLSQWLAFHFVFAFVFNLTEWWAERMARRNEKKYGVRWILARHIILPVLLIEDAQPFLAWRRVGAMTRKKTFAVTKNIANLLGLFYFLCLPLSVVVFYLLFSHTTHLERWIAGIAIYLAVLVVLYQVLNVILQLVLYRYLAFDEVEEGFAQEIVDNSVSSSLFY